MVSKTATSGAPPQKDRSLSKPRILYLISIICICIISLIQIYTVTFYVPEYFSVFLDDEHLPDISTHLLPRHYHDSNGSQPYIRYDDAAIRAIPGTARSHALPNAIPATRIIPVAFAENKAYHISQRTNSTGTDSIIGNRNKQKGKYNADHDYSKDYRTLYSYNPSVVPLFNTANDDRYAHDNLATEDIQLLTGGDDSVRYVAIYRAYLGSNCFGRDHPRRALMKAGEQVSYVVVALLNATLDLVEGTDVLIDLNAPYHPDRYGMQNLDDCRVFLLRGILHFICNSIILKMRIVRNLNNKNHKISNDGTHHTGRGLKTPFLYPNIHGDGLSVILLAEPINMRLGKNYQMFRIPANTTQTKPNSFDTGYYNYYLQTLPLPHEYKQMNVSPDPNYSQDYFHKRMWQNSEQSANASNIPPPSFPTLDQYHFITACDKNPIGRDECVNRTQDHVTYPFFTPDRDWGTACCVTVNLQLSTPNLDQSATTVLVGISHAKLSKRKPWWFQDLYGRYDDTGFDQYLSRFVAYSQETLEIVARSGYFCLGFASTHGEGDNTLAGRNTQFNLRLFNESFACPVVHFISGFSEVVGDPEKAIISYGINDSHPRMMLVNKADIVKSLLGQL